MRVLITPPTNWPPDFIKDDEPKLKLMNSHAAHSCLKQGVRLLEQRGTPTSDSHNYGESDEQLAPLVCVACSKEQYVLLKILSQN